ncbi:hypothetical protein D9M68_964060 [compost metagenome]
MLEFAGIHLRRLFLQRGGAGAAEQGIQPASETSFLQGHAGFLVPYAGAVLREAR